MTEQEEINLAHKTDLHPTFIKKRLQEGWKLIGDADDGQGTVVLWETKNGIYVEEFFGERREEKRLRRLTKQDMPAILRKFIPNWNG